MVECICSPLYGDCGVHSPPDCDSIWLQTKEV